MDLQTTSTATDPAVRLADLRASAKGWHGVQLAVLGFIGLCGVLQGASPSDPHWLQVLAGVLVLASLVLACTATVLVATAAWPVSEGPVSEGTGDASGQVPDEVHRTARRLRSGIGLTFVAVVVLAVAATSSWWPTSADAASSPSVEVSTNQGSACGELRDDGPGAVTIATADGDVTVPLPQLVSLRPVSGC
jgi:hypothetical protein